MAIRTGLPALAEGQHGAFLRDQARRSGVPDRVLRGWISSGLLDPFGARTLRSALTEFTPQDLAAAHLLDIRPPAWLSHLTAGGMHGFDEFPAVETPFHIPIPRGHYVTRSDLRVHTTQDMPLADRVFIDSMPVTNPVRTLIDCSPILDSRRLTAALDGALRDRLLTEDRLMHRIAELRGSGRYGIPRLLAVIEGSEPSRGGHSWLERKYLEITAAAGFPRPEVQRHFGRVDGRLIRVDCYYPDFRLVVELLGYRWHRSKAQMNRDMERVNKLITKGERVLQFTYDHLTLAPAVVLQSVAAAIDPGLCQEPQLIVPGQSPTAFT